MRIIINTKNPVSFSVLNAGDVFMVDDEVCMKCNTFHGDVANTVCLESGQMCMFDHDTEVYPVEAELRVSKL